MPTDQLNRKLRDLRISVTDRCNFRCPYCMPAELYGERYKFLPKSQVMTFEEITRLTGIMVRLGAVKVRLTGGEPLVRNTVEKLVSMLSAIDGVGDLTMTTNGYLLAQQAQTLPSYKEQHGRCEDAPCCGCCGDGMDDGYGSPADDAWHDANEYPDW